MRYYLSLICILCISFYSNAQFWAQRGAGSQNNMAYDICKDAAGNTFTTGYFSSSMNVNSVAVNAAGITDMFLVKTNSTGAVQWVKRAGGNNITQGLAVCCDHAGNVIVTGFFYGTASWDSQTLNSIGQRDGFVAKYDSNGNLLWVVQAEGVKEESANKVTADLNDNILVTGEFSSPAFTMGSGNLSSPNASLDVFTAKLNSAGNTVWVKSGTGTFIDRGTQITCNSNGDVYVAGEFSDTVTFDQVHYNIMYNALFIIKYSATGQEQWFRFMGSGNTMKMSGLRCDNSDNVVALGNYTGSLVYFNFPAAFTLTNNYQNNYFVSAISPAGALMWSATDGSSALMSSQCLDISSAGEIAAGGTYECRFSDFADQYGQGIFCSLGYRDCFISTYNSGGSWIKSRCYGGNKTDYLNGLSYDINSNILVAGAFSKSIFFPTFTNNYLGYGGQAGYSSTANCSENTSYQESYSFSNNGNIDVYFGCAIDMNKLPMDMFMRTGLGCITDFPEFCINNCEDTVTQCSNMTLHSNTMWNGNYGPDYHYLWSNGDTASTTHVNTTGLYTIVFTSDDGCWSDRDSIYVIIHPAPSVPLITDSRGNNNHAAITNPIQYCYPDSVLLTASVPPGISVQWSGGLPNDSTFNANMPGFHSFIVTAMDSFGCTNSNFINVDAQEHFNPIDPRLLCLDDTDFNDTISVCQFQQVYFFPYDTLSNPTFNTSYCIPPIQTDVNWSCNNPNATFNPQTNCMSNLMNGITFLDSGLFTINIEIDQCNLCGSDTSYVSKTIYVQLLPVISGTLSLNVTGNTSFCPGDSSLLVASGSTYPYQWSTGDNNDSIYVYGGGNYTVTSHVDTVSSAGCPSTIAGSANILVTVEALPVVSIIPADAVICPNDSIQLSCTTIPGSSYSWQGPGGAIPVNSSTIWVSTPGIYSCTRTSPMCQLISNTIVVQQYNTPLVIVNGVDISCNHSPVELQLLCGPSSNIQWQSPLSGSGLTQTITNPGTYTCTVIQCGITTPLSINIAGSNPVSTIVTADTLDFCQGDSITLHSGTVADSYLWFPGGQTTSSISVYASGQYVLQTSDSINCTATDTVSCTVFPSNLPTPIALDTMICLGEGITLTASGQAPIRWLNSNLQIVGTGNFYSVQGLSQSDFYLVYTDSANCKSMVDTAYVEVENCDSLPIPNIVTINNDGANDIFPNFGENGILYSIQIFNRWGKRIYHSIDSYTQWSGLDDDGNRLSDGTYYYILSLIHATGRKQEAHGWVMVVNGK